jgi:hypothetical protein
VAISNAIEYNIRNEQFYSVSPHHLQPQWISRAAD